MKKYNKIVSKKKTIMVVVDRRLDRVTNLTWVGRGDNRCHFSI
jgi:hypothetical protein